MQLRNAGMVATDTKSIEYSKAERIKDFFYFNDFYLVSSGLILFLLYIIFYT